MLVHMLVHCLCIFFSPPRVEGAGGLAWLVYQPTLAAHRYEVAESANTRFFPVNAINKLRIGGKSLYVGERAV